jgi:isoquinoline 1-oxidoreductase
MTVVSPLTRRDFFAALGAGIAVLMVPATAPSAAPAAALPYAYPTDINAYLLIAPDGTVTVFSGKIEMGQGVMTSLAQMLAEELGVDLEAVDMVLGDTDRCPWDMGTFGSLTTRMFGPALRAAGAAARLVLLDLAAARLKVPKSRLDVRRGVVFVATDPMRRIGYGELARGRKILRVVTEPAPLRTPAQFQVMGRSPLRLDGHAKVCGEALYAADIRRPGMVYARILRPPAHGAQLTHADAAAAAAMPGVRVVQTQDLLAVLHADPEAADTALASVKAQWSTPAPALNPENIFDHIVATAPPFKDTRVRGDTTTAPQSAERRFVSAFRKGYVAHAPMEPHAAVAEVIGRRVTVWASTQTPFPTRDRVAAALAWEPRDVRVITPFLGGGFGGKSADRQAVEAAVLAKQCGKPVQVAWNRAEEFFYDRFDPACEVRLESALGADGRVKTWDFTVYAAGERGAAPVYDFPNVRIRSAGAPSYGQTGSLPPMHPFDVGPWRAPGANMNIFAAESQMDIMAAAAGVDPLEFRLRHLTDPRMRRVLMAAAAAFGWTPAAAPSRRGIGMACSTDAGSYVATMAEVSVDRDDGSVRVLRIVCAVDFGTLVNPEGARMQIEGGLTMGLGYSLSEELNFKGGEILDQNFSSYHLPRFSTVPHIETVLLDNPEVVPQGGGEPPITTMGAALANAVFDATGARLLRLPMTPPRVLAALAGRAPGAA